MYQERLRLDEFTQSEVHRTKPVNPCNSQSNKLGELVELGKVGSSHVGHPNMKIYPDES